MKFKLSTVANIVVRFCMELHPEAQSEMTAVIAEYNENERIIKLKEQANIPASGDIEFRSMLIIVMDELADRGEVIKIESTNQNINNTGGIENE